MRQYTPSPINRGVAVNRHTNPATITARINNRKVAANNPDGSVDARDCLSVDVDEYVQKLKTSHSTAGGQYTRETAHNPKFKLVYYPYDQNHIYRRNLKTGIDECILERVKGEWFPCTILRDSEIQSLKAFQGAVGIDCDRILEKSRTHIKTKQTGTYNVGGKCTYRSDYTVDALPGRPKGRANKFKKLMSTVKVATTKVTKV